MVHFAILILIPFILLATPAPMDYAELIEQPTSRAKDYAAELYLRQNATDREARALFFQVRAPKPAHLSALAEKSGDSSLSDLLACRNAGTKDLYENASPVCLAIALAPARAPHLSPKERLEVADRVAPIDPIKALIFRAMAGPNPLGETLDEPDAFFSIALQGPLEYLRTSANQSLSPKQIAKIENDSRMTRLMERGFVTDFPPKLTASLLAVKPNALDHKGAFYLGLHALRSGDKTLAIEAFHTAEAKGWSRYGKDRALFWLWKASNEERYLHTLAESWDVNFYALMAKERLGKPWPKVITQAKASANAKNTYDEETLFDPFFWAQLHNIIHRGDETRMRQELDKLAHKRAEPYRAAIAYRLGANDDHYFLNPWPDLIEDLGVSDRAIFLALMRQESRFIPAAISTSYAIGSMQFMPFLIEHMDKERDQNPNAWAHFSPYNQIPYAKTHLKWLQARLAHPLHIAYAYNGGIGFTNRMLAGDIFGKGPYEPFMSLERVPIEEPREYGKIILANYAIYRREFGHPITMAKLLQMLVPPTDLYPDR